MIWGIIQTFLGSFGQIFIKKSLNEAKLSDRLFTFFGNIFSLFVAIIFIFIGFLNAAYFTDFLFLSLIILSVTIFFIKFPMAWPIFREEKISVIAPFQNIHKIIIILLSFLIFQNVSFISFLVTIFAVITVILFNIDFKTFNFPKNIKKISLWQFVQAIHTMVTAYIISIADHLNFFIFYIIFASIVFIIILIKNKEYTVLKTLPKNFYKYRFLAVIMGTTAHVLSLFLIKQFGIILTILLSFLGIIFSLIFSYIYFSDKPSKKNIIQAVFICLFIGLGYYFR